MGQEKDVEGKRIRKILKAFRLLVREMKAKIKKEKDIFTVRSRVKKGGGVTNEEFQHSVKTVSPPNTHTQYVRTNIGVNGVSRALKKEEKIREREKRKHSLIRK